MNIEEPLKDHLQAAAADQPPYPPDVDAIKARGRRRRLTSRMMIGVGAAAAVVVTVLLATSFLPDQPAAVQPTTQTTIQTTSQTTLPDAANPAAPQSTSTTTAAPVPVPATILEDAVAFFGDEGLTVIANGVERLIPGDRYYEGISDLISDGEGGLLFKHVAAPVPWPSGSIVRLAVGATMPQVVVPGPGFATGNERRLLGLVDGGFAYVDTVTDTAHFLVTVTVAGLDGSNPRQVLSKEFPSGSAIPEFVAARGNRIVIIEQDSCPTVRIFDLDGRQLDQTAALDCNFFVSDIDLSPDGSRLLVAGVTGAGKMMVIDTGTGATLRQVDTAGIWLVAWKSENQALVVGESGGGTLDLETGELTVLGPFTSRVAALGGVVLADDATTGSGLNQLPCNPSAFAAPESTDWMASADEAVVETWQELRNLAAACEWEQLSDIAEQDQTSISFGGPIRLVKLWVLESASGSDSGTELLDVTSLPPARTTDGWVWPAVSSTNADADWQVLLDAGLLTEKEVADMKDFGGYLGFRVGIADDGTWLFGIAGD